MLHDRVIDSIFTPPGHNDIELGDTLDHMGAGQDNPVGIDEEAGA